MQCSTWQLCLVWQELEPRHQPQPTLAPSCVQEVQLEWSLAIGDLKLDIYIYKWLSQFKLMSSSKVGHLGWAEQ